MKNGCTTSALKNAGKSEELCLWNASSVLQFLVGWLGLNANILYSLMMMNDGGKIWSRKFMKLLHNCTKCCHGNGGISLKTIFPDEELMFARQLANLISKLNFMAFYGFLQSFFEIRRIMWNLNAVLWSWLFNLRAYSMSKLTTGK